MDDNTGTPPGKRNSAGRNQHRPADRHDRSYRWFFSHREMVEDVLRGFVNREWVNELDFLSLEQVSDVFVGGKLELRAGDSVWRIRWQGSPLYILLAFEFQSTPDRFMAVRWMVYVGMIYQRLIDNGTVTSGDRLPPVLPIVIYNGRAPWSSAEELSELIEPVPGFDEFLPRLRYLIVDEHRFDPVHLAAMPNRVAALFGLELSRSPEEVIRGIGRVLELVPAGHTLRQVFAVWLRMVLIPSRITGADLPREVQDLEEFKTMLEESVLQWEKSWMEQGLEKGRREGEASLLLRQAEKKFGALPDAIRARIRDASSPQLLEWAERLLTATTLEEMMGSPG